MNFPRASASSGFKFGIGLSSIAGATLLLAVALDMLTQPTYILNPDSSASVVAFINNFIVPSSTLLSIAATVGFPGVILALAGAVILASSKKKSKKVAYSTLLFMAIGFMAFAFTAPAFSATYVAQTREVNQFAGHPYSYLVEYAIDSAGVKQYLALNGTTNKVDYGGPGNAGGATGTNFTAILLNSAVTNSHIILSAGTFTLGHTVKVTNAGVWLSGQGTATQIFVQNSLNAIAFNWQSSNSIISDLSLNGNVANQGTAGDWAGFTIQNSANVTITNTDIYKTRGNCIEFVNTAGAFINGVAANNHAYDCGQGQSTNLSTGIVATAVNGIVITANVVETNKGDGIYAESVTRASITGNICNYNGGVGIELSTKWNGTAIVGNSCNYNGNDGIHAEITANLVNGALSISGNTANHNTGDGIKLFRNGATGQIAGVVITGNTAMDNTGAGIQGIHSTKTVVEGNSAYNDRAGTQTWGIEFGSSDGIETIIGNTVFGNSVGGLNPPPNGNGYSIVEGNRGYNPKGVIASPFDNTNNLIPDAGSLTATPANSTTMTVINSPKLVIFSQTATDTAGETTTIKIDGTAVPSINGVALASGFTFAVVLQPGQTYFATWHTGDASWLVSGE